MLHLKSSDKTSVLHSDGVHDNFMKYLTKQVIDLILPLIIAIINESVVESTVQLCFKAVARRQTPSEYSQTA